MENVHKGHRERLKTRFDEHGLEPFSDVEALELLLFYALPRCSTNELAHRLLERFGSFREVMEADASELELVKGVGRSGARVIALVRELGRRYQLSDKSRGTSVLGTTQQMAEYFMPLFSYATDEQAYAVSVNSAGRVIRCHRLASGLSNRVEFSARQIVDIALRDNAAYMVMAHNHLSDKALPSMADIAATRQISAVLGAVGVTLADHIIVSGEEYVSMRCTGSLVME